MPPKKTTKMPSPLPKNEVLTDTRKQKWVLGASIGKGGFGEIYTAASGEKAPTKDSDYSFVIKVEPHDNGPLFVEKTFYLRVAKEDDVVTWMKRRNFKTFGMPRMHGNGSHECGTTKYRFLVMDRYAKDLSSLLESCNKIFPLATVLQLSIQILDVLEYIHSNGYVHADVKPANLLLGLKKGTENQVFVVDFGLAARINTTKDPKKKHNGTADYLGRDGHDGATTLRGDMDILAFNMVHWLSAKLPWEGVKDCTAVQKAKESAMQKVPEFLKACFGKKQVPDVILNFVKYVSKMKIDEAPNYSNVREMFIGSLKKEGVKFDSPLVFIKPLEQQNGEAQKVRTSPRKTTKKRSVVQRKSLTNDDTIFYSAEEDLEEMQEVVEEAKLKKRKISSKAGPNKEKVSWRDCATAKASRVETAGVFVPFNPKPYASKKSQNPK